MVCGTRSLLTRKNQNVNAQETAAQPVPMLTKMDCSGAFHRPVETKSYKMPRIKLGISSPIQPVSSSASVISRTRSLGFGVMVLMYPARAMSVKVPAVSVITPDRK